MDLSKRLNIQTTAVCDVMQRLNYERRVADFSFTHKHTRADLFLIREGRDTTPTPVKSMQVNNPSLMEQPCEINPSMGERRQAFGPLKKIVAGIFFNSLTFKTERNDYTCI